MMKLETKAQLFFLAEVIISVIIGYWLGLFWGIASFGLGIGIYWTKFQNP